MLIQVKVLPGPGRTQPNIYVYYIRLYNKPVTLINGPKMAQYTKLIEVKSLGPSKSAGNRLRSVSGCYRVRNREKQRSTHTKEEKREN